MEQHSVADIELKTQNGLLFLFCIAFKRFLALEYLKSIAVSVMKKSWEMLMLTEANDVLFMDHACNSTHPILQILHFHIANNHSYCFINTVIKLASQLANLTFLKILTVHCILYYREYI